MVKGVFYELFLFPLIPIPLRSINCLLVREKHVKGFNNRSNGEAIIDQEFGFRTIAAFLASVASKLIR